MRHTILFIILLMLACCGTIEQVYEAPEERVEPVAVVTPWDCSVEIESYFQLEEDGQLTKPSTLLMTKAADRMVRAMGTGTVIAINGDVLTVLTAKHVVEDAVMYNIQRDGVAGRGRDVLHHPDNDISIFYVESRPLAEMLKVAPLAEAVPAPGEKLELVGNALGMGLRWMQPGPMGGTRTLTVLGVEVYEGSYHSYPGCSGGGIWNEGKLVGVVSMVVVHRIPFPGVRPVPLADLGLFVGADVIYPFATK